MQGALHPSNPSVFLLCLLYKVCSVVVLGDLFAFSWKWRIWWVSSWCESQKPNRSCTWLVFEIPIYSKTLHSLWWQYSYEFVNIRKPLRPFLGQHVCLKRNESSGLGSVHVFAVVTPGRARYRYSSNICWKIRKWYFHYITYLHDVIYKVIHITYIHISSVYTYIMCIITY